ncbi:hypothetical protein N7453_010690 [Penicillium expansum]|nr:hypothetical protein N7453_010690 [Penicillium expansum]
MESSDHAERTERPRSDSVSSVHSHDHFIERLFIESENNLSRDVLPLRPLIETTPESTSESAAESVKGLKEGKKLAENISSTSTSTWFVLEGLAIVLSLLLLIAIIVILSQFDGHPQPAWKYVSLNSVISWLSTISKAFLGSLAVILALAFDPFTQNLMHYYSKLVTDVSQIATVSSSVLYNVIGLTIHSGAVWYVDPVFKANVYSSLLNNDKTKPWSIPQYTCSTGNCTWDPIATLELTSSCANITDNLKFVCYNDKEFITGYGGPNCSVNLPGSPTSASFVFNKSDGYPVTVAAVKSTQAIVYKYPYHFATQMIAPDGLLLEGPFLPGKTKWQALECALIPTVRSVRTTVTNGTYHEESLATWTNITFQYEPSGPGYYLYPPWEPDMGMEHNQSFVLSSLSFVAMGWFFNSIFGGRAKLSSRFGVTFTSSADSYAGADIIEAIAYANITGCTANTAEKLQCVVENVAAAASKTFRDSVAPGYEPGNGTIVGQAKSSMTYVAVHWQWIALPALVWLLGLATLVGTIWKTRRGSVPQWKNDLIPLLFLYKNEQDEGVPGERTDSLKVRLYKSDDRMVLDG